VVVLSLLRTRLLLEVSRYSHIDSVAVVSVQSDIGAAFEHNALRYRFLSTRLTFYTRRYMHGPYSAGDVDRYYELQVPDQLESEPNSHFADSEYTCYARWFHCNVARATNVQSRTSQGYARCPFRGHFDFIVPVLSASIGLHCFYRAMHFSANARSWDRMSSVCPSVCLSFCNVSDL